MQRSAISHRSVLTDCYALDADHLVIQLRTGKEVQSVRLIHNDPFAGGCMGLRPWEGEPAPMSRSLELEHHQLWTICTCPRYKREQYYFEITDEAETLYLLEDGFYTREELHRPGRVLQYFKFPWMNPADICTPPSWVGDMVWYQIFPDRFRRGSDHPRRMHCKPWNDTAVIGGEDFYGGDLPGITEKLPYLKELGVTGLYLTPIFLSDSNHKYNTFDYEQIDPDFGTEEDMLQLIKTAHKLGLRVMVDAVFNHSGLLFGPWQDVLRHGSQSPCYSWFFVNEDPLPDTGANTEDGRYFTFAFERYMPKLNTNDPAVADYLLERCRHWVRSWGVDGIRFDVGNEVSHWFLKRINGALKAEKPDLFLLGEIWGDSIQWLLGDEYDSVMNYSFLYSLNNFWIDSSMDSRHFMYLINRCRSLYPAQLEPVLFNFLDTHDTPRALNRCGGRDALFQQLALLMTMPGSPCIYYGTELGLEGGNDPDNRRPMPWDRLETAAGQAFFTQVQALVALRKAQPALRGTEVQWLHDPAHPRLIHYVRGRIHVLLNCGSDSVDAETGKLLFSRLLDGNTLAPGGCVILMT